MQQTIQQQKETKSNFFFVNGDQTFYNFSEIKATFRNRFQNTRSNLKNLFQFEIYLIKSK